MYAGNNPSQALGDSLKNSLLIPVNFTPYGAHMGYNYTLIGLYYYLANYNRLSGTTTLLISTALFAIGYAITYVRIRLLMVHPG